MVRATLAGTIGALIGGLVGAALWATLMYFLELEIGWLAWGVGGLVGLGTAIAAGEGRTIATGAIAAVVALGSIALGKYVGVHYLADHYIEQVQAGLDGQFAMSLDDAQIALADQLVEEYESAGKPLAWPPGMTVEVADSAEDYPPDLWADAQARWRAMSDTERESYRAQHEAALRSMLTSLDSSMRSQIDMEGFKSSFGLFDILFAILAVATAFQLGRGGGGE